MFMLKTALPYVTAVLGAVSAACSPAPMPVSQSLRDPSNPAAAEGAPPRPQPSQSAASATVYACPMHPEVTSASPGHCSKCGMNLVPKP